MLRNVAVEGAIRGQKSNVTGDMAAILMTYERNADEDLAADMALYCIAAPHRPDLLPNGRFMSR